MSYDQRTWPFFLSRARINPLQELTISNSPTTVGVEKTHPPVSNCHSNWNVGESWGAVECCAKASPERASSICPNHRPTANSQEGGKSDRDCGEYPIRICGIRLIPGHFEMCLSP